MSRAVLPWWLALAATLPHAGSWAQATRVETLPAVDIVGTTLLPGSDLPLSRVPANLQTLSGALLRGQPGSTLSDLLEAQGSGLTLNSAQGNPHQMDISLRGFAASPLLGTPQGLSVFLDGVRMNELFGDAVNWDLIPASAIASIQLIPGSNPAFGMNTLGGAIALTTKRGATEYPQAPGGRLAVSAGGFGRRDASLESGGQAGDWDWFVSGNTSTDPGWGQHNASRLQQWFGKLGQHGDTLDLDLSLQFADNRLEGSQTLPLSFSNIREAYTWPDLNRNRMAGVALHLSKAVSERWQLSANLYRRVFHNQNFSSNANSDFGIDSPVQATNDASTLRQASAGASVQAAYTGKLAALPLHLAIGASLDDGRARFSREQQDASFTADRGSVGLNALVLQTDADATTRYSGAFISSSLDLNPRWTLTLSGRLNRADITIADRSGSAPELNGAHRFSRFNPAVGLNFNPLPSFTAYANLSQGMRAPTAIELTCADPQAPCRLPNSFVSDPPLKPVVSTTTELGARGKLGSSGSWRAALYRTVLQDDLQFVSSNGFVANAGYFQNVGQTLRQGLDLDASQGIGALNLSLRYSLLDARYSTGFKQASAANSSADGQGAVQVLPGNRLPGLPRHTLKLRLEGPVLPALPGLQLGLNLLARSAVYARGDENNLDSHGRLPGYALLQLDARHALTPRLELSARVVNLLDRRYANFGALGSNVFTGPGGSFDGANAQREQFRGWGEPRAVWLGLSYAVGPG